jgi:hypothetical protein
LWAKAAVFALFSTLNTQLSTYPFNAMGIVAPSQLDTLGEYGAVKCNFLTFLACLDNILHF